MRSFKSNENIHNNVTAQSDQELYIWTEHACNGHCTCERVLYVLTGPQTDIGFSTWTGL